MTYLGFYTKQVFEWVPFLNCHTAMKNSELDLDSHTTPLDPLDEKQEGEETLVTDSDEEEPTWAKIPFLHTPHKKIPKKAKEQKALIKAQQDILKFNRMGTHLANERTLLAWVSTLLFCLC